MERWFSSPSFFRIVEVSIGIFLIVLFFNLMQRLLLAKIKDSDLRYRARKTIALISYFVIALFVAIVFSDRLGRLTVTFGVIGAGIAFALQEVIASFAGWSAIALGQFYKSGDRVLLGGIMGDVIDISLLRTTLMECGDWVKSDLYNGRIVRIANSFVFKEPVYNYSADFPFVWDEITIPVKYGSDHHLARALLSQAANDVMGEYVPQAQQRWNQMVKKYLIEDAQINPMISLVVNDNWLEFTVRFVVSYKLRRGKKDELYTRILDDFLATQGKVTFASTTIHLVEAPPLHVDLESRACERGNFEKRMG
ncbi:MAG: mechanosensitive ion channel [Phormidesmis sp. RL_2_1]|nr:mechanosensitive ion channel [Phormidesmis sp. RL_2_1]